MSLRITGRPAGAEKSMFHKLLLRQLRKQECDVDSVPEPWRRMLDVISRHYEDTDRARYLLERSIGVSADEMQDLNAKLAAERDQFAHLFRHSPVGMARVDLAGRISEVNPQFARILGRQAGDLAGQSVAGLALDGGRDKIAGRLNHLAQGVQSDVSCQESFARADGGTVFTKFSASAVCDEAGRPMHLIVVLEDISDWTHLQIELRHAQKLESVGRLAAGIAHEINTPIQYVGTNISFLEAAFSDLLALCDVYRNACAKGELATLGPIEVAEIRAAEEAADLSYVRDQVPRSLSSTQDGIKRVAKIVQSMKNFAHPDRGERAVADINAALQSTITVASNELKYVANVETHFAELPLLPCFLSDLNQVFLNLLVNAAHAVEDVVGKSGVMGRIGVSTSVQGDHIVIGISDSGAGIPEEIRDRIFDPFFTTKEVGRGTGQGLALARSVVVEKHGGSISFQSEVNQGTTFLIRLPLLHESSETVHETVRDDAV
jgi:two-component system, NtrC family, sensor kinase